MYRIGVISQGWDSAGLTFKIVTTHYENRNNKKGDRTIWRGPEACLMLLLGFGCLSIRLYLVYILSTVMRLPGAVVSYDNIVSLSHATSHVFLCLGQITVLPRMAWVSILYVSLDAEMVVQQMNKRHL